MKQTNDYLTENAQIKKMELEAYAQKKGYQIVNFERYVHKKREGDALLAILCIELLAMSAIAIVLAVKYLELLHVIA